MVAVYAMLRTKAVMYTMGQLLLPSTRLLASHWLRQ